MYKRYITKHGLTPSPRVIARACQKNQCIVGKIHPSAIIAEPSKIVKIKNKHGEWITLLRFDPYHSIAFDPETGEVLGVFTSAEFYPKGTATFLLNALLQLSGEKGAQYFTPLQIDLILTPEAIIVDEEKTDMLRRIGFRHTFAHARKEIERNSTPKPRVKGDLRKKEELSKKNNGDDID